MKNTWKWIVGVMSGKNDREFGLTLGAGVVAPARRRNLLLIQSSGISVDGIMDVMRNGTFLEKARATQLLPAAGITAASSAVISLLTAGVMDLNMLGVPGRAYMRFDCLPVRYRAAGDFDANSVTVSIEELDLSYTKFELLGAFWE